MITNQDLTCAEVVELTMSLSANIESIEKCLQHSVKCDIKENILYYSERLNNMKLLKEKMNNTIGVKR